MAITAMVPQLRTTDLQASIRFYTQVLGFSIEFTHEDFYAGIRAGGHLLHLKLVDETDPSIEAVDRGGHFHLYFETDELETLATKLHDLAVGFVEEIHATPWGTREFAIRDDQGHRLYFGASR